ncbi:MAG: LPS assembly protein LptD [bacterium]
MRSGGRPPALELAPAAPRARGAVSTFCLLALLAAGLLVPGRALAQEGNEPDASTTKPSPPVRLEASDLTLDARTWTAVASGDVKISYEETTLNADEVFLDLEHEEAQARGRVRLLRGDDVLEADALTFRWKEETGTISAGRLSFGETGYHIEGEYLEKTGPDTYLLEDGSFTTCRCPSPEDRLPWVLKARKAEVTIGGIAKVEKATFLIARVPVLYLPAAYVPVKVRRETGLLLPRIGQSSRHGFEFSIPFFWAINASADSTITLNAMTKRGVKPAAELRYRPTRTTSGEWNLAAFQDLKVDEVRYGVTGRHVQRLSAAFYDKMDVNVVSDNEYLEDFPGEVGNASDRLVESQGELGFRREGFHSTLEATYSDLVAETGGRRVPQRVPHLHASFLRRPVGFPWLLAGLRSNATHFLTEEGDRRGRYDLLPELSTVFPLRPGLSLTARGAMREVLAWQDWDDRTSEGADSRTLLEAGSALEATLGRSYRWRTYRLLHLVRPRLQYQWVRKIGGDPFPVVLDGLDELEKRNWLTYGIDSSVWGGPEGGAGLPVLNGMLASFSLSQSIDLERDADVSPSRRLFSDVLLSARLRPRPALGLLMDLQVDPYRAVLRFLETGLGYEESKGRMGLRVSYLYHRARLVDPITRVELWDAYTLLYRFAGIEPTVHTRIEGRLPDQWSASLDTLYLLESAGKYENRLLVKYLSVCRCWSVIFGVRQTVRPDDVSFSVRVQLEGLGAQF